MIPDKPYASFLEVRVAIRAVPGFADAKVLAFCNLRSYARYAPPSSHLAVVDIGSPYGLQSWHIAFWLE
jgi:hypothetical protein